MLNVMNSMVEHINSMKQVMIVIEENFIESDNVRVKQSIHIYQLMRENISTKITSTNFFTY